VEAKSRQFGSAPSFKRYPPATLYTLRHTYASHLVQVGMPLLYVASALGHRDARMVERHYGHFAPRPLRTSMATSV